MRWEQACLSTKMQYPLLNFQQGDVVSAFLYEMV